jgi:hypothetical protein
MGCAAGSWDPEKPMPDPHANVGGRIYSTALATLTLEVYYRYLPLYQTNAPMDEFGEAAPAAKEGAEPKKEPKK